MIDTRPRVPQAAALAVAALQWMTVAGVAHAASEDEFMVAEPIAGDLHRLKIEASYDFVNRFVDVFDVRAKQGAAYDNAGDYRGGHVSAGFNFTQQWSAFGTYWRRNIDYGPDTNGIDSWQVGVQYTPEIDPQARHRLMFRLSAWGDRAGSLAKSTPTQVRGTTFNGLRVDDPNDVQGQADIAYSYRLGNYNTLTGFVSGGISRVSVGDITTRLNRGGCNFNVRIGSNNIANGSLASPCVVGGATINSASLSLDASQFGLDVGKDVNYTAGFINVGASWRWRYQGFGAQVGYQFQYLMRGDLDDRMSRFGVSPIRSNHTFGVELSYNVYKGVDVFIRGQAFLNNFVGTVPFLYNAATASRLDRTYGYASIGVRLLAF